MPLKIEGRYHLGTLELAPSTKLEFNIVRHHGKDFVDIRTWFLNEGTWIPTKKGVHFLLEKQDEFQKLLSRVSSYDPQELKPDVD